ncbi:MAG: UvrD-helicase domain-containing protein, partial [Candidatus Eremiobacterota bacterium]
MNNFNNPLTDGERAFVTFLDRELPQDWEIYVQPFLNGDRPDIVILNPKVGVMIWEIKDWKLGCYRNNQGNISVINGNLDYKIQSPLSQVNHYRNNILNLYVPALGEKIDKQPGARGIFKTGIYFHNADTDYARKFFNYPQYVTVIGRDGLKWDLDKIIPDVYIKENCNITPEDNSIFDALRVWLIPPFHSKEQGTEIKLNEKQLIHGQPCKGHHRIKGVAGSGKTIVLAYRAAKLASEGNKVLVVTYNITLWHYIRDQIARTPYDFSWNNIVFKHFHGFCKDEFVRLEITFPKGYKGKDFFIKTIPDTLSDGLSNSIFCNKAEKNHPEFDAILIDEGQDFCQEWYNLLCKYTTERDELVLFCDTRQNIYERDIKWTDGKMKNVKFRGPWATLPDVSYRLPGLLAQKLNEFAVSFLEQNIEDQKIKPVQSDLFDNSQLLWENANTLEDGLNRVFLPNPSKRPVGFLSQILFFQNIN